MVANAELHKGTFLEAQDAPLVSLLLRRSALGLCPMHRALPTVARHGR